MSSTTTPTHWLCFPSLFNAGRSLSFPCNERGEVALDVLSPRAINNYLFARATIGREFNYPKIEPVLH